MRAWIQTHDSEEVEAVDLWVQKEKDRGERENQKVSSRGEHRFKMITEDKSGEHELTA